MQNFDRSKPHEEIVLLVDRRVDADPASLCNLSAPLSAPRPIDRNAMPPPTSAPGSRDTKLDRDGPSPGFTKKCTPQRVSRLITRIYHVK